MVENFDDFLEEYYEPQFDWYDRKAARNKLLHRTMKTAQIIVAAILPVAVTLFPVTTNEFWKNVIIIAAVLLIILEGLEFLLNYQKKWLNYRTTAEGLRREKQIFNTGTGDYKDANDPEEMFVDRVMSLTSRENRYWEITTRKAQEA